MVLTIEWLIIGGGVHGTYLSHLLVNAARISRDDIRVLDPHENPLAVWHRNTANCGMKYLRSPATHNIDLPILSLYRYAKETRFAATEFIPPYNRPSLSLFKRHSAHVIESNRLHGLRVRGRALALSKNKNWITAHTTAGSIKARNVILALGLGEQPCWPQWALTLRRAGAPIGHVFSPDYLSVEKPKNVKTAVVGGGISAIQTALSLSSGTRPLETWFISRHDLRESQYDFDPCWIGPKCLKNFYPADYDQRRAAIDRARMRGTVTGEILADLHDGLAAGSLKFIKGRIRSAKAVHGRIHLTTAGATIQADAVILATGFHKKRPGGPFVDQVIHEFDLKCGTCGYPIVGDDLRWSSNIFVAGPLAELQLGPCARNIIGARNAGRLLLKALKIR